MELSEKVNTLFNDLLDSTIAIRKEVKLLEDDIISRAKKGNKYNAIIEKRKAIKSMIDYETIASVAVIARALKIELEVDDKKKIPFLSVRDLYED